MAETAENQLPRAGGSPVLRQGWYGRKFKATGGASLRCVEQSFVLMVTEGCITTERIIWAVPVVLEFLRPFLEDLTAPFRAEDIVPETKVLVEDE
jgi:hypothetical protein